MYTSFLLSTLLPLLAAALPSSSPEALSRRTPSTPFTLLADYNNDPNVGGSATHASNGNFFIGRDTAVSCPTPGQPCPSSNETALTVDDATGIASMYSRYTPHQTVYIAVNGALSYVTPTLPLTTNNLTPFTYHPSPDGPGLGGFTFTGLGSSGWLLCPIPGLSPGDAASGDQGVWQVFAKIGGMVDAGCAGGEGGGVLGV